MFEILFSLLFSGFQDNHINNKNIIISLTPSQEMIDNCRRGAKEGIIKAEFQKNDEKSEKETLAIVEAACIAVNRGQISVNNEEYNKYMNLKTKAEKVEYEKELLLTHKIIKD